MYQHSTPSIQGRLDEGIGCGKVFKKVFVVDIVDIDLEMLVGAEEVGIELHAKD